MAETLELPRDPQVLDRADCCVVGGGWAGVSAALRAAEAGLETVLVEERGALGWETPHGLDLFLDPARAVPATLHRVLDVLAGQNAFRDGILDPVAAECLLDRLLAEAKVRVHFRVLAGAYSPERGLVRLTTKSGPLAIQARCAVDATETSRLARAAGARFVPAPPSGGFAHSRSMLLCAVTPPAAPASFDLDGAEVTVRPTLWPHEAHVQVRYGQQEPARAETASRFLLAKAVEALRTRLPGFENASISVSSHETFALAVPRLDEASLPECLCVAGPACLGRKPALQERAGLGEAAAARVAEQLRCAAGR